jgi:hypothetical protein
MCPFALRLGCSINRQGCYCRCHRRRRLLLPSAIILLSCSGIVVLVLLPLLLPVGSNSNSTATSSTGKLPWLPLRVMRISSPLTDSGQRGRHDTLVRYRPSDRYLIVKHSVDWGPRLQLETTKPLVSLLDSLGSDNVTLDGILKSFSDLMLGLDSGVKCGNQMCR